MWRTCGGPSWPAHLPNTHQALDPIRAPPPSSQGTGTSWGPVGDKSGPRWQQGGVWHWCDPDRASWGGDPGPHDRSLATESRGAGALPTAPRGWAGRCGALSSHLTGLLAFYCPAPSLGPLFTHQRLRKSTLPASGSGQGTSSRPPSSSWPALSPSPLSAI